MRNDNRRSAVDAEPIGDGKGAEKKEVEVRVYLRSGVVFMWARSGQWRAAVLRRELRG